MAMLGKKPVLLPSMIIASGLLLSACQMTAPTQTANNWSDVTGTEWQLAALMDGAKTLTPDASVEASANFTDDGKVNGSSGCNNYVGNYTQNAVDLTFSPLAGTRKMCINGAMEIENAFLQATEHVSGWTMDNSDLVLTDASGKAIMKFTASAP